MRAFLGIVFTVWLTLMVSQPAFAERRVALVIGNSSYQNVARLGNPASDAPALTSLTPAAISRRPRCGVRCATFPIRPATPTLR
jgi:hypothetical protein